MELTCKNINPSTTCDFKATGSTVKEVADKMLEHAKVEHAADLQGKSDAEVLEMMQSKVHA